MRRGPTVWWCEPCRTLVSIVKTVCAAGHPPPPRDEPPGPRYCEHRFQCKECMDSLAHVVRSWQEKVARLERQLAEALAR